MKKIIATLLCAFMIASFVSIPGLCVSANGNTSEPATFTNEELLKEIALAYDRQGAQIRYDQAAATHRRHLTVKPEDATAQKQIYLDCSSYVNACYLQAFGVNVLNGSFAEQRANTANYTAYAKNNPDNVDVVGYWENADYTTEAEIKALLTSVKEQLQIGDLLVYRHNRDGSEIGHVYIYIGDNTFMHCQGGGSYSVSKYDPARSYDQIKNEGNQIDSISVETIFENTASTRYLFKATETDVVVNFSLLRPLARGLTPTQESINRMKIAGLSMEKISSKWENSEVYRGDEITYTVTLENTNANDTGIESISVRWNGSLATGETTNSYSVDNIKVWEIVKEEASYSGDGYNDGELTNGKVALSLPVSYIPCGTGTEVMVVMAAYDKVTGELITMSEIEKHTFVNGELFFEFTPEITIPETAGDYFVKSMIWRSDTLVPLWKELVLE